MTRRSSPVRAFWAGVCALLLASPGLPAAAQSTLSQGTQISATLASADINSKTAQVGDGFTMNVVAPYPNGDPAFAGARLRGHIADVASGGQGKPARLQLAFDSIVFPDGTSAPIAATVVAANSKNENTTARKGLAAAIGAAIGSQTIGRIIGGSAGSVVGLLGGAAGGYLYAANDKPNLDLARGAAVSIQTTSDVYFQRRQAAQ